MHEDVISIDELLTPQSFERGNYCAHLYAPFSSKLNRRVHLYSHNMYDLWVLLETNQSIKKFNEKVLSFPINFKNGHATKASPRAVSQDIDGLITIHTLQTKDGDGELDWDGWCGLYGYQYQNWSKDSLKSNSIELANLKHLLRFSSVAGLTIDYSMENQILSELENFRKITFYKLVQKFPFFDSEDINACIASLIIRKKIFSDIRLSPFSMITELSVHHELS